MRRNLRIIVVPFLGAMLLAQQAAALSCASPDMREPKPNVFMGEMRSLEVIGADTQMCTHRMKVEVLAVELGALNVGDNITIEQRHWICPSHKNKPKTPFRYGLYAPKEGIYNVGMCGGLAPYTAHQIFKEPPAHTAQEIDSHEQ